jgi:serine-type D-Ala-D-Ala carboxypeptidase/endopeptidase
MVVLNLVPMTPTPLRLSSPRFWVRRSVIAIALLGLSGHSVLAADLTPNAAVDSAARVFMADPQAVGLSIGVLEADRSYTFNYGTTVRGEKRPPTEHTLYPIASITKTFTGSLLALATVEQKLSLDQDIRKFLKGDYANLEIRGQPIRVRDLLNHRSGLPFMLPDRPDLMPGYQGEPITRYLERTAKALDNYTREDFYADLRQVRLDAPPGEKFRYSNAAAQLAGYVLEGIYETSFEALVQEKINHPLGMNETAIALPPRELDRLARGYDGTEILFPPPRNDLQAAGALKSSVADLLKYLRWHLAEADPAVKLSHEPIFTDGNYAAALNWQIFKNNGRRLIWQEGTVPGFTSYLLFEPELNLGLVVLTNDSDRMSSARIATLANEILKALDNRSVLLP